MASFQALLAEVQRGVLEVMRFCQTSQHSAKPGSAHPVSAKPAKLLPADLAQASPALDFGEATVSRDPTGRCSLRRDRATAANPPVAKVTAPEVCVPAAEVEAPSPCSVSRERHVGKRIKLGGRLLHPQLAPTATGSYGEAPRAVGALSIRDQACDVAAVPDACSAGPPANDADARAALVVHESKDLSHCLHDAEPRILEHPCPANDDVSQRTSIGSTPEAVGPPVASGCSGPKQSTDFQELLAQLDAEDMVSKRGEDAVLYSSSAQEVPCPELAAAHQVPVSREADAVPLSILPPLPHHAGSDAPQLAVPLIPERVQPDPAVESVREASACGEVVAKHQTVSSVMPIPPQLAKSSQLRKEPNSVRRASALRRGIRRAPSARVTFAQELVVAASPPDWYLWRIAGDVADEGRTWSRKDHEHALRERVRERLSVEAGGSSQRCAESVQTFPQEMAAPAEPPGGPPLWQQQHICSPIVEVPLVDQVNRRTREDNLERPRAGGELDAAGHTRPHRKRPKPDDGAVEQCVASVEMKGPATSSKASRSSALSEISRILQISEDDAQWAFAVLKLPSKLKGSDLAAAVGRAFRLVASSVHPDAREPLAEDGAELHSHEALAKLQRAREALRRRAASEVACANGVQFLPPAPLAVMPRCSRVAGEAGSRQWTIEWTPAEDTQAPNDSRPPVTRYELSAREWTTGRYVVVATIEPYFDPETSRFVKAGELRSCVLLEADLRPQLRAGGRLALRLTAVNDAGKTRSSKLVIDASCTWKPRSQLF